MAATQRLQAIQLISSSSSPASARAPLVLRGRAGFASPAPRPTAAFRRGRRASSAAKESQRAALLATRRSSVQWQRGERLVLLASLARWAEQFLPIQLRAAALMKKNLIPCTGRASKKFLRPAPTEPVFTRVLPPSPSNAFSRAAGPCSSKILWSAAAPAGKCLTECRAGPRKTPQ